MSFRFVDAVFWIAVGCCAVAQLAILRSVLRASPARHSPVQDGSAVDPGSAVHRAIDIAWAVIPGFALAAVLLYTWRAMR